MAAVVAAGWDPVAEGLVAAERVLVAGAAPACRVNLGSSGAFSSALLIITGSLPVWLGAGPRGFAPPAPSGRFPPGCNNAAAI